MQMVMIIVGGYVVASSPPVYRLIRWLANIPTTPRGAVAFVALVSNFHVADLLRLQPDLRGLSGAGNCAAIIRRGYRALGAAAYLGLGSVWALGLSSSAALLMATKTAMPPAL